MAYTLELALSLLPFEINLLPRGPIGIELEQVGMWRLPNERNGQWLATGICGNDISSSCLYVAAIVTVYAGALSPIVLLMVGGLLYLFRKIYAEVGDALPLNGGAYNCLLNTTTKFKASMAACMTILSYLATAVISAKTAVEYLSTLIPGIPILLMTIGLLLAFALLTISGITESARVALNIFVFHLSTLTILNPLIALVALSIMPIPEIVEAKKSLLADVAFQSGGGVVSWIDCY